MAFLIFPSRWKTQPQYPVTLSTRDTRIRSPNVRAFLGSEPFLDASKGSILQRSGTTDFGASRNNMYVGWSNAIGPQGILIDSNVDNIFTDATNATVGVLRRKRDTTLRGASLFGAFPSGGGNPRVQANCPWSDGNIYWDFGDFTTGRLTITSPGFGTDPEAYVFIAGQNYREVFRNGISLGSNSAGQTLTTSGNPFYIGAPNTLVSTDNEEIYVAIMMPYAWTIAEAIAWSLEPYSIFTPIKGSTFFSLPREMGLMGAMSL